MTRKARPLIVSLALAGVTLVVLLLGLSFASLRSFERARDRLDRTAEVQVTLTRSLQLLVDAETGQRGFLLTDQARYLEPFDAARREIPPTMQRLDGVLRDSPAQRARLARLHELVADKLAELDETVALERAGEHERALAVVESDRGKRVMDAIRDLGASMQSAEDALVAQRSMAAARVARFSFGVIAAACACLLVVGFLIQRIGREDARRERENAELRIAALEDFAGRVAHDVCSPLASVSLAVDLAKRHPGQAKSMASLDGATRTLRRVASLVDGLLAFAKAGARPVEGARADVRAVVGEIVATMRRAAQDRGVDLELGTLCPATVACDPGVLTSMVCNLLENAIKHMGDATVRRVTVRALPAQGMTRIEVRDTGPGVPRELWTKVFDPYVRAPGATAPGLGLGLAAVRRLALAHGGSVGIDRNAPAGTVFWFELPNEPQGKAKPVAALERRPRHASGGVFFRARHA